MWKKEGNEEKGREIGSRKTKLSWRKKQIKGSIERGGREGNARGGAVEVVTEMMEIGE